ncbi:MAG: DUF721 domain-containing protein [Acidobacteria bacterium]|nr:DUF721 domain-containing protein [Acidobacteriota bacterium]MBI3427824.1 DUF721 domain-containing protein [Acidobacteriota bacterium]
MNSLLKLLPTMIRLSGDNEEVREQAVFTAWRTIAGKSLARSCVPFRLYQKQLVIAVQDLTWKKQMEAVAGEFLFRLNSLLGAPFVTFIEFRVDPHHVLDTRQPDEQGFEFQHTAELTEELRSAAEQIKDEALRAQFLRAAAKYLERTGG